jgi:uncharacterized protein (UPF0335 family)
MSENTETTTANQLRSFIERIERLQEEKREISDQQKDVMSEAKSSGFEPKIIKKIVAIHKRNRSEIEEEEALMETYMSALGMV